MNQPNDNAKAAESRPSEPPDHEFVGGYTIDPTQPGTCQICERPHAEHSKSQPTEPELSAKELLACELTKLLDNSPCSYDEVIAALISQTDWFRKALQDELDAQASEGIENPLRDAAAPVPVVARASEEDRLLNAYRRIHSLEIAIDDFRKRRGKHDGEHDSASVGCSKCEQAYVEAESQLDLDVHRDVTAPALRSEEPSREELSAMVKTLIAADDSYTPEGDDEYRTKYWAHLAKAALASRSSEEPLLVKLIDRYESEIARGLWQTSEPGIRHVLHDLKLIAGIPLGRASAEVRAGGPQGDKK